MLPGTIAVRADRRFRGDAPGELARPTRSRQRQGFFAGLFGIQNAGSFFRVSAET